MRVILDKLMEAEKLILAAQHIAAITADQPTQDGLKELIIKLLDVATPIAAKAEAAGQQDTYTEGNIINRCDSIYLVERVYELSDEHMKEYNLYYRKRAVLTKIFGVNGVDREDIALPHQEMTFFPEGV
jgi:hypothetical protein